MKKYFLLLTVFHSQMRNQLPYIHKKLSVFCANHHHAENFYYINRLLEYLWKFYIKYKCIIINGINIEIYIIYIYI